MEPLSRNLPSARHLWLGTLAVIVSAALLYFLYRGLDFAAFWQALSGAHLSWLVLLFFATPAEQVLRAWKWRQLLYDLKPIPTRRYFAAIMAGYAVTSIVPLGVSPLVRSWLVARLEHLRLATVLTSAVLERFIDGVVFGLLVAGFALFGTIPEVEGQLRTGVAVAGAGSLALFMLLVFFLLRLKRMLAHPGSLATRLLTWLTRRVPRLGDLPAALLEGLIYPRSALRKLGILLASFAMKLVALSHFVWAGLALGVELSLSDYLFLLIFASFAFILSRFVRLPGGFVIASSYALRLLGVADETALAMVLFVSFMSLLATLSIGLVSLYSSGLSVAELRNPRTGL